MTELKPLPHAAADADADTLASVMAHTILSGHWAGGDTFPRELDLCQHFAASRNRVRNALAILSSCGLIERTAGRGTIVRDISDWHLLDPNMSLWLAELETPHPQLVNEVFNFRLAVEPYVSELAALSATARELAQIEDAFNGMCNTAHDPDQRNAHIDYDIAFHEAIYSASHNLIWRQMGRLLRPSIMALITHSHHRVERLDDSLERHRQVLEAIRLRQPAAARTATEHVLDRTATDLELSGKRVAQTTGAPTTL